MNNLLFPYSTTNRVGASSLFRLAKILNASSDLICNGASALRKQSPSRDFCTRSDPDVRRLAETARNNRFGQLQAVDLESVAPAIRTDTEGDNLRDDVPEIFENKEAILAAIPSYEEPYVKVPKVLNKMSLLGAGMKLIHGGIVHHREMVVTQVLMLASAH